MTGVSTDIGPLADLPIGRCTAVADGTAVVVRTHEGVVAFPSRCLHQASSLAGGWVDGDTLVCPHHFWRYRLADGSLVGGGSGDALGPMPATIVDDRVHVELPEPTPATTLRDELLARARTYDRATEFARRETPARPSPPTDPIDPPGAP